MKNPTWPILQCLWEWTWQYQGEFWQEHRLFVCYNSAVCIWHSLSGRVWGKKLYCFLSHPTVLISLQQSFWCSRTERQFIMMSVCVSRGNARETARTVDPSFFRILCGMLGKIKVLVLFVETTLQSQCMQGTFFWRLHIIQNPHNRRLISSRNKCEVGGRVLRVHKSRTIVAYFCS